MSEQTHEVTLPESGSPASGSPSDGAGVPSQSDSQRADLSRAAELDDQNRRVDEAQPDPELQARIQRRAEELLLEVFPEQASRQQDQPYIPTFEDSEDLTFEDRMDRLETAWRQDAENRALREQVNALNAEVDQLQTKYPHMSKRDVLMVVAAAGDRQVNLDRIAAASHNTMQARLDQYHQSKLKEMQERPLPATPDPRRNQGTMGATTAPRSYADAKKVLAERLRASGWGRK